MTTSTHPVGQVFAALYRSPACVVDGLPELGFDLRGWREGDADDALLLNRCVGPTLDVGCGPGRMTARLAERGHIALGIDVVPEAIEHTRRRGAAALVRDVFDVIPGEGRWGTVLLADGNLGIGGDPLVLLSRIRQLLGPCGRVVADVAPEGTGLRVGDVRVHVDSMASLPFPWAVVGADVIGELAVRAGLRLTELTAPPRPIAVLEVAR